MEQADGRSRAEALRREMVETQIRARGVRDARVLAAMAEVPREKFVPAHLRPEAYEDRPLPLSDEQTISQPYIVALMVEALRLKPDDIILEIGAGSGYAAAIMASIAREVFTIERISTLAQQAASNLIDAGFANVVVRHDDGTRGWKEKGPFDAILVSAAAPFIPETLKTQLKPGGRLVMPVGENDRAQEVVRLTRLANGQFRREELADVRFVPLLKGQTWEGERPVVKERSIQPALPRGQEHPPLAELIRRHAQPFDTYEAADLDPLIERIGESQIVLIGEASHGTHEFYAMRNRITQRLISEKAFNILALEADWPDAARVDLYVRNDEPRRYDWQAFSRFPAWMWRNREFISFTDWLRAHNQTLPSPERIGIYGLDIYSLYNSASLVIAYLEEIDPELAQIARTRYGCLTPWQEDPAAYGQTALEGAYQGCEDEVTSMLTALFENRDRYQKYDPERFFDATRNARLIISAERYYRTMYYGSRVAWNLRDDHMFQTLEAILEHRGAGTKAVVWAHNSHIGDARATEMSKRGERNLGELCRKGFGDSAYLIGMGMHHGHVAAASGWNLPMQIHTVLPSLAESYEHHFHMTGLSGLIVPLRPGRELDLVTRLATPRLQRAIGVIYRPESERHSHYFEADLARQFNEYIFFENTTPITPLDTHEIRTMPDTYPFGV